ncbi:CynX/NimT family MFS transporter [Tropicimonas sp. IMCC6043]|uniref:MFS transporter n=1 Tax=Tropicimonas sp. IMCC6043 TaxID=2510645 RepID=UPI00101C037D|nr:MFS transporter [Tropicimonas sp. IMCC6043]RYH05788.1 MFS transporter [Tropicimonas sp. IMCC6043]
MAEKSDWRAILSAFLVGVAGAVQVGRVAPVTTFLQQDLQLDLFTLGWLVSLITLASAVFGLIAGYWVVRIGLRASIVTGALFMGVCALVSAVATSVPILVGARVLEGLGYLLVVVAAPTLIAHEATQKDASFALAMWGTFFTLGLSIAAFAGGMISEIIGWRGWFLASAGLVVLAALAALVSTPGDERHADARSDIWATVYAMPKASWLLGAAFLGLTLLSLSILSLLPTFLVQEYGLTPGSAGGVTGAVALTSIAGSLSYGALANRLSETGIASVASLFLIASAFPTFANAATAGQIVPFAAVSIFMSGILVAQTFSAVPRVARTPRLIGPSNGLVAQFGSVGALTGPPLVGALISTANWNAVPFVVAGFTLSFVVLFGLALSSHKASLSEEFT